MDAIILCGGRGSRLSSVVSDVPKPLAPVDGRPFLDRVLSYLAGIPFVSRAILATGHLGERVEAHYGAQFDRLPLSYSRELIPLGTGGATLQAMRHFHVDQHFLIANGDSFVDANVSTLLGLAQRTEASLALCLFYLEDSARFGVVTREGELVTGFQEKCGLKVPGYINAGLYVASPEAFRDWISTAGNLSLEKVVLPALVSRRRVFGATSGTRFIDIGLPETYAAACGFFAHDLVTNSHAGGVGA